MRTTILTATNTLSVLASEELPETTDEEAMTTTEIIEVITALKSLGPSSGVKMEETIEKTIENLCEKLKNKK